MYVTKSRNRSDEKIKSITYVCISINFQAREIYPKCAAIIQDSIKADSV